MRRDSGGGKRTGPETVAGLVVRAATGVIRAAAPHWRARDLRHDHYRQ